jgi:hypothetical protein
MRESRNRLRLDMSGNQGWDPVTLPHRGWFLRHLRPPKEEPVDRITIVSDEIVGEITPNIYGHFTEHIGDVICDGIWVGRDSKVPNIGGVEELARS